MRLRSFSNLAADGRYRIERGHWFLKNYGDFSPPNLSPLIRSQRKQVVAAPENFAGDFCCGSEQAKGGESRCAFAGTRLADEAEHFSFIDADVDAAHSLHHSKGYAEIANFQERAHAVMVEHRER